MSKRIKKKLYKHQRITMNKTKLLKLELHEMMRYQEKLKNDKWYIEAKLKVLDEKYKNKLIDYGEILEEDDSYDSMEDK